MICTIFDNICLSSDFLFRNFLSIPSDTKIKWSFGANSREENKFLNLDYLAGPNSWVIMLNTWQVSIITFSDAHWIIKFSIRHKNNKKASPHYSIWNIRPCSETNNSFSRGFKQQHIPTDFNQIFSCFMGRWCKRQHYSKFSNLCNLWELVFFF